MNLVLTVLEIVAPVFLLASIGFIWVRMGVEYKVEFVTRLAMTLSVPCLIFTALMRTEIDPAALTTLSLAAAVVYAVLTAVTAIALLVFRLDMRTYLAPLIYGNTGNLGLPLAMFAFGEAGLGYAVIVFAVMALWNFTFGIWVVSGGGSVVRALREPLLWGTILGGIFLWQGWETPKFLTNTLDLVGQIAIPIMLITLGVAVARLTPGRMMLAVGLSALKLILCIGIAWGVGTLFQLEPVALAVLILQISTPVAVTSYLLAEKYGADAQAVAGLVVASTLMSVAAIPLLLAILL
ncbi:AEC family transporter [Pseudooceanicola sediminis]|uniref:AEC family transporter n=1 Tax=Pseudooceanicola sediminis TaxID=2211117 RepID=A0A399IZ80_9RHOB|nr:AEC family transporter [Pseudooceanicola sediminis]KAA2313389.1 AEC family transporter [Puniceibacterium sp. HSS470]RII38331.1 AEC family transporter [Pseudooceanicola sediminis]